MSTHVTPWRDWYHVTVWAYGQWLPGDERGWRERHHRQHVEGDYRHPPDDTPERRSFLRYSQSVLKYPPRQFTRCERPLIGATIVEHLDHHQLPILIVSVGGRHVHALIQCHDHNPRRRLGYAKQRVWSQLYRGNPRVWEKRSRAEPIKDRRHGAAAFRYIQRHQAQGAWVWTFRDPRPKSPSLPGDGVAPGGGESG